MARASTVTLLPLDEFAKIAGIHPLHFNQVEVADLAPATICGFPLLQYSWQAADHLGREEIAQAIAQAEDTICKYLNYKVLPCWEVYESPAVRSVVPEGNTPTTPVYGNPTVLLDWKKVIAAGIKGTTLIDADAAIVFSDTDADGYKETATITVATTVTDSEEIHIYYPSKSGADEWEIRPISVSIVGGVATITCRRELLVKEVYLEGLSTRAVDGLVDANFLATVDVYRVYNNTATQGLVDTTASTITVKDSRLGQVAYTFTSPYSKLTIYYRAGEIYKNSYRTMSPIWARAVTYYTLALLDRPLCACKPLEVFAKHWKEDLAIVVGSPTGSSRYQFSNRRFDNPLGTTRAAAYVWDLIQRYKIVGGN